MVAPTNLKQGAIMGGKAWRPRAALRSLVASVGISMLGLVATAEARITGINYVFTQPFADHIFGSVGQYEELVGTATGEVVPEDPLNAIITDIDLAPRVHGKVQYSFTFTIRRPVDPSKSNRTLLYDIANRGVKTVTALQCVIPNPPAFCDGSLEEQGFIIVWSGWEGDLLTAPGRFQLNAPVAKNRDGSSITGRVVTEYGLSSPATFVPLGGGFFGTARDYDPVSLDNNNPAATLTMRVHQDDPKVPIPNRDRKSVV